VGLAIPSLQGRRRIEPRDALVQGLRAIAPWLRADTAGWAAIGENDHVLDALIASLVARAKACGLCDETYDADADCARSEGWIALPLPDALPQLVLRPK
jgi:hypothetical protein